MDTISAKKIYSYTVIFEPAEEGGYIVSVPALPGCLTQGETFEEAQANVKEAIEGYLESLIERQQEIPLESEHMIISRIPATVS